MSGDDGRTRVRSRTSSRTSSRARRWRSIALAGALACVAGVVAPSVNGGPAGAADVTSRLVTVAPTRVADTRPGEGPAGDGLEGAVAPGSLVRVQIAGAIGVPAASMVAAVLNVTTTETVGAGYVQVLPGDSGTVGASSNLNVDAAGSTIANQVTVPVGADGSVRIFTQAGGHLVVDVFGYFTPSGATTSGRYAPVAPPAPRRVLDTRDGGAALPAGGTVRVPVVTGTSLGGGVVAPGQASAVVVNLTVTEATGAGFWQAVPTGGSTALGASSNLNVTRAGQTIANQAVVPVGADGTITIFSQRGGHVVVDVAGVFTGTSSASSTVGLFVPTVPRRMLDTREATAPVVGPLPAGGVVDVAPGSDLGVPSTASGIAANVTMVSATDTGYVQLLPTPTGGATGGTSSVLNVEYAGQTIANAAYTGLGDQSRIRLVTQRGGHLVADVTGWFTGGGVSTATTSPNPTSPNPTNPISTTAPTTPATPRFAFVGSYNVGQSRPTSPGISTWQVDPSTGALTFRSVATSSNPAFVAVHPTLRMVYAVNENAPQGSLQAFRYDAATGALTFDSQRDLGSNPTHLVVDPLGRWVIAANYSSGTWQVVALTGSGSLGSITDTEVRTGSGPSPRQLSSHPHGLAWDPSGTYLAGADLGTDVVEVFTMSGTGQLQSSDTATITAGAGPRHVVFSTNGRTLYVINELNGTISVFAFDPATGQIGALLQTAQLMPSDFTTGWSGAEILVHPAGDFLYASHRGYVSHPQANSVVRFRIDRTSGTLTRLGWTTGTSEVRSMSLDPTGTWLYVANQSADTIVQYRVDTSTGDLVPTGNVRSSAYPTAIAFVR